MPIRYVNVYILTQDFRIILYSFHLNFFLYPTIDWRSLTKTKLCTEILAGFFCNMNYKTLHYNDTGVSFINHKT